MVVEKSFPLRTSSCPMCDNTYAETNIFVFQSKIQPVRRAGKKWSPACSLCQVLAVWIFSEMKQLHFNLFFVSPNPIIFSYLCLCLPLLSLSGVKNEEKNIGRDLWPPVYFYFLVAEKSLEFSKWSVLGLQQRRHVPRLFLAPSEKEKRTEMAKI